ncbi:hypothetical protein FISHEDRAFT_58141 [Fistulina hepatica ATCC 64428]|nr:hypothetical protein FISHEDRAFT_58141 [Fistulina hepatica ATCC 64428]
MATTRSEQLLREISAKDCESRVSHVLASPSRSQPPRAPSTSSPHRYSRSSSDFSADSALRSKLEHALYPHSPSRKSVEGRRGWPFGMRSPVVSPVPDLRGFLSDDVLDDDVDDNAPSDSASQDSDLNLPTPPPTPPHTFSGPIRRRSPGPLVTPLLLSYRVDASSRPQTPHRVTTPRTVQPPSPYRNTTPRSPMPHSGFLPHSAIPYGCSTPRTPSRTKTPVPYPNTPRLIPLPSPSDDELTSSSSALATPPSPFETALDFHSHPKIHHRHTASSSFPPPSSGRRPPGIDMRRPDFEGRRSYSSYDAGTVPRSSAPRRSTFHGPTSPRSDLGDSPRTDTSSEPLYSPPPAPLSTRLPDTPLRPVFNARVASAQLRSCVGYVSFGDVEGLGLPPTGEDESKEASKKARRKWFW